MEWWNQVKQLFQRAEQSAPTTPVLHEPLERHKTTGAHYEQWREGVVVKRFNQWIHEQYAIFRQHERNEQDDAIDFLNTPSAKGFVVHFGQTGYTKRDAEYIQLYLREQVLKYSYRTQVADSRTYSSDQATERSDRYYFKPKIDRSATKQEFPAPLLDQQFGNIALELIMRNDKPFRLKLSATSYQDRQFDEARGFPALLEAIIR